MIQSTINSLDQNEALKMPNGDRQVRNRVFLCSLVMKNLTWENHFFRSRIVMQLIKQHWSNACETVIQMKWKLTSNNWISRWHYAAIGKMKIVLSWLDFFRGDCIYVCECVLCAKWLFFVAISVFTRCDHCQHIDIVVIIIGFSGLYLVIELESDNQHVKRLIIFKAQDKCQMKCAQFTMVKWIFHVQFYNAK